MTAHLVPRTRLAGSLGALTVALGVTFAAAGLGAIASADAPGFYARLSRPEWAPPAGWFGPVWSVLYTLMAVAAWLVWRAAGWHGARTAIALYGLQLAVNALWSWIFFQWQAGAAAFAGALLLALLVLAAMAAFWRIRRLAALLLLPYLAWVVFATVLTFSIWRRNPGLLG